MMDEVWRLRLGYALLGLFVGLFVFTWIFVALFRQGMLDADFRTPVNALMLLAVILVPPVLFALVGWNKGRSTQTA